MDVGTLELALLGLIVVSLLQCIPWWLQPTQRCDIFFSEAPLRLRIAKPTEHQLAQLFTAFSQALRLGFWESELSDYFDDAEFLDREVFLELLYDEAERFFRQNALSENQHFVMRRDGQVVEFYIGTDLDDQPNRPLFRLYQSPNK